MKFRRSNVICSGIFLLVVSLSFIATGARDSEADKSSGKPVSNNIPTKAIPSGNSVSRARISKHRFPDFKLEYRPPDDQYKGELFSLNQEYPLKPPQISDDPELAALMKLPYDKPDVVDDYLIAVRDYCFKGNTESRDSTAINYDDDWQQKNKFRKWYHVPWQHYGEKGREGIHGLTREATAHAGQYGATHKTSFQSHAVAVYNSIGGYTIGKVWEDQFDPNPRVAKFPEGTVVAKVLFTQAKEDEVAYLHNPLIWKGYIQDPKFPNDPTKRKVQSLRLIQMDIMVRDSRAEATGGWIFGTYCYNGSVNEKNRWFNLVPVGVQWGNDEKVTSFEMNSTYTTPSPSQTLYNPDLKETIISKSKNLPPQHLGWGGRLNGPADYFRSSCMSCHSTAQYPGLSRQHPDFDSRLEYEPGDSNWMKWFRNLKCGESFDTSNGRQAISCDYSLQLQIGIENFYNWKSKVMEGNFTFRNDTFAPSAEAEE